jgi:hypothetical protein
MGGKPMTMKSDLLRALFMILGIVPIMLLALKSDSLALILSPVILLALCLIALAMPWPDEASV